MPDDFVKTLPEWQVYIADNEGNIDFKDRGRSGGLWPARDGKVDSNGNVYYSGKVGGRRVIIFKVVPKPKEQPSSNEDDW